jgi:hypothetical protein
MVRDRYPGGSVSWDQLCRPVFHPSNGYRWFRWGEASGASNNSFSCIAEVKNTWIFTTTPSSFESWNTVTAHGTQVVLSRMQWILGFKMPLYYSRRWLGSTAAYAASWNTRKVMQMHGAWRHYHTHPFLYRTAASIGTYGRGGVVWQTHSQRPH